MSLHTDLQTERTMGTSEQMNQLAPYPEIENPHIFHKSRSKNGFQKKKSVKNYTFLAYKEGKNKQSLTLPIFPPKEQKVSILQGYDVML